MRSRESGGLSLAKPWRDRKPRGRRRKGACSPLPSNLCAPVAKCEETCHPALVVKEKRRYGTARLRPARRPAPLRGEAQAELSGAQGVPAHGSPTADPK